LTGSSASAGRMKDLRRVVKYLYDTYDIKFILTGSSAYYLKNHFSESLAGRKVLYEIFPLTFAEFLRFQGVDYSTPKLTLDGLVSSVFSEFSYDKLSSYYDEYINYGGFPAVALTRSNERKGQLLEEIYSAYINLDVEVLADFKTNSDLTDLISLLAARVGSRINIDERETIAFEAKETPTSSYKTKLSKRAKQLGIVKSRLIGRQRVAKFDEYIWGGII
jgi:predicted AAA+ superfamily ATPase